MLVTAFAAFSVYTCMYAYRKPFTVADFGNTRFWGIDYKIWLVMAQTTGYTLSKFVGIRFIAELNKGTRFMSVIKLIGLGWFCLLLFALVPSPYNIIFLLLNGLPLGLIYGIVFSYIEGRKTTEFLGAVLAASFIFASGFTQSAGKWVMEIFGTSIWWMPFMTGLVFFIPLLFFTWLLDRTPPPDAEDIASRTERRVMNQAERKKFIRTFLPGLLLLVFAYILLTILRDYRSNFAANIWKEQGLENNTAIYTTSELIPSIVILVLMALLISVKSNIRALMINHSIVVFGFFLSALSTLLFQAGWVDPFWWMTLTGTGLYMGYVPFNCMLFERLIASFRYVSTAGFIIYVADAFGYLGSDAVLLVKNFGNFSVSWTGFFVDLVLGVSAAGVLLTTTAAFYFKRKYNRQSMASSIIHYA